MDSKSKYSINDMKDILIELLNFHVDHSQTKLEVDSFLKEGDINKLSLTETMQEVNKMTIMSFMVNNILYMQDEDFIKSVVEVKNQLFFGSDNTKGDENNKLDMLIDSIYLELLEYREEQKIEKELGQ